MGRQSKVVIALFENYPDIVKIPDLQEMIGVSRTKAYGLISTNQIRSFRVGNSIRIPKKFIIEYLLKNWYNTSEVV